MSLKYEPYSKMLHISAEWLFLNPRNPPCGLTALLEEDSGLVLPRCLGVGFGVQILGRRGSGCLETQGKRGFRFEKLGRKPRRSSCLAACIHRLLVSAGVQGFRCSSLGVWKCGFCGLWFLVFGFWFVAFGVWFVVCGL